MYSFHMAKFSLFRVELEWRKKKSHLELKYSVYIPSSSSHLEFIKPTVNDQNII